MYNRRIDQNCEFKSRKQKCEFKKFWQAEKLFLGEDGGGSPAPENRFVGAGDPPTAPQKAFIRPCREVTHLYKMIFRGG